MAETLAPMTMKETVPAEVAAAQEQETVPVEEEHCGVPAPPREGVEKEQVPLVDVPVVVEPEAPVAANPPSSDPSNVEEGPSQVPTERPFSFDFDSLQSWVCGAIDPFINGMMTTTPKEAPPPPAGFWQPATPKQNEDDDDDNNNTSNGEDVPTLRNSDLRVEEDLLRYTSAGESVKTLFQSFEWGVKRNPRAPCLGKRKTAKSPYTWKTYGQIQREAEKIGIYLKGLGVTQGQRVGFSGKNAPEYLTAIQGCFWAGATTVPIYDTFGEKECQFILKQAEIQVVFVSKENLETMLTWAKAIPSVKHIIVWGCNSNNQESNKNNDDEDDEWPPGKGVDFVIYEDCLKASADVDPIISSPPKPEDLAIIMYTSGTTGMPKGVMLPHSAMVATMASIERYFILVGGQVETEDVFLSYLPLAHVFDFVCECCLLYRGAKIGFYRGDQRTLVDDIGTLKPTIFVGVPRIFDRIYARVNAMMDEGSPAKKLLYLFFFDQKLAALKKGAKWDQASFIGDALIFSKIKARLGGRVRIIASGGAPLPQHLEDWLKVTMCCPVVQGYGLTETCAASCVSMPDRADQRGTVGPPLFSNECKLVPVPELGYDGTPEGGGEICFRGPSIMSGYYHRPDLTDEVMTKDGWFYSGDIARIGINGCVTIVDRKKQLFKLLQGEYVSPEKVEGIAAKSQLVGQIWVSGSSTEACVVAVIVPSNEAITKYGGKEAACQSRELESAILEDLERVCRAEKLKGFEIPKAVLFHPEEWTPESGFVTPSFKLKRPALQKHFRAEIDGLYAVLNSKRHASNW